MVIFGYLQKLVNVSASFRLFIENHHCKRIFFGGPHDNGYGRTLEVCTDVKLCEKVVLLESVSFATDLQRLTKRFKVTKFESVFSTKMLPSAASNLPALPLIPTFGNYASAA